MRRIFVPLHGPQDARLLLQLASHLASPDGAQIEAALIEDRAGLEEAPPPGPDAAATREIFAEWAAGLQTFSSTLQATWREIPDGPVYASASIGRASDLIITRSLGRVVEADRVRHAGVVERGFRDALLTSGRLTLLAPPGRVAVSRLLDRVVVAWDGSRGAAHALGQSLALLERAASVCVVIVGRNTVGGRAREAIESYVKLYNSDGRLIVRENSHRQTGRVLIEAMREMQATAVVMGTTGRSQPLHAAPAGAILGGTVLGGTILKIIEDAGFPILTTV